MSLRIPEYALVRGILKEPLSDYARDDRSWIRFDDHQVVIEAMDIPAFRASFISLSRFMKVIYDIKDMVGD